MLATDAQIDAQKGLDFLQSGSEDDDCYTEVYSEGASEDFIYDIQDEWNLNFGKDKLR